MYQRNTEPFSGPNLSASQQFITITAIILAILAVMAFSPRRDTSKVVPGIACSVLSEAEIGAVIGTPVQLLPTTGNVCRYVATSSESERSVIVVAHRVDAPQPHLTYSVAVVEPQRDPGTAENERARLVALVPRGGNLAQK